MATEKKKTLRYLLVVCSVYINCEKVFFFFELTEILSLEKIMYTRQISHVFSVAPGRGKSRVERKYNTSRRILASLSRKKHLFLGRKAMEKGKKKNLIISVAPQKAIGISLSFLPFLPILWKNRERTCEGKNCIYRGEERISKKCGLYEEGSYLGYLLFCEMCVRRA